MSEEQDLQAEVDRLEAELAKLARVPKNIRRALLILVGLLPAAAIGSGFSYIVNMPGKRYDMDSFLRVGFDQVPRKLVIERSNFLPVGSTCEITELDYTEQAEVCTASLRCEGRTIHAGRGACYATPRYTGPGLLYVEVSGAKRFVIRHGFERAAAWTDGSDWVELVGFEELEGQITGVHEGAIELADGTTIEIIDETKFGPGGAADLAEVRALHDNHDMVRALVGVSTRTRKGKPMRVAWTLRVEAI